MSSSAPGPAPFLIPHPLKPATINPGTWDQIFTAASFTRSDVSPAGTSQDGDVTVTVGPELWGLQFSSATNATYFGPDPSQDALLNRAWVGDALNSVVMTLSSTLSKSVPLSQGDGSVWKAFGISSDSNAQLKAFISLIDPPLITTPLMVTLYNSGTPKDPNPNAVWCISTLRQYQITVQLEFQVSISKPFANTPIGKAISWINDAGNLGLNIVIADIESVLATIPLQISATKTTTYSLDTLAPTETWTISFMFEILNFKFAVDFSDSGTTFYLIPMPNFTLTDIVNDLSTAVGNIGGLDSNQMPKLGADSIFAKVIANNLSFWYININKDFSVGTGALELADPESAPPPAPVTFDVGLLADWSIGTAPNEIPVIVGLTYQSKPKLFHGRLILQGDPIFQLQRYPGYDWRLSQAVLGYPGISNITPTLSLWELFTAGERGSPPSELAHFPFALAAADVTYQTFNNTLGSGSTVTFFLEIAAGPQPQENTSAAPSWFTWDEVSISFTRTASTSPSTPAAPAVPATQTASAVQATPASAATATTTTSMQIYSGVSLHSKPATLLPPATLDVALSYDSSTGGSSDWTLQGSLSNISVKLLANIFFNDQCSSGAMAVLGELNLSRLDVLYTYSSGAASSFLISAVLTLGDLALDLSYQYVSSLHGKDKPTAAQMKFGANGPPHAEITQITPDAATTQWTFEAFLQVKDQTSTIASIANSIVPGKGDTLPYFVGSIVVAAKGDPLNAPIKLIYTGTNTQGSIMAVWVNIGPFNMTFIQYRPPATTSSSTPTVKQILRISCDQIPMLDKVPLVNQLPQPFDHLIYMWVDDAETDPNLKGFTRDNIGGNNAVNAALTAISIPPILLKDASTSTAPADIVLQAGHHFMVVANDKLVLDHIFTPGPADQNPPASTPASGAPASTVVQPGKVAVTPTPSAPAPAPAPAEQQPPEVPATKGDTNKQAGPLSISGLTVQYKQGSLFVGVDATLVLGPITFSIIGFTIKLDLARVQLNDLSAIITEGLVSVSIHGLDAAVDKEPLTLAGVFIHDITNDATGNTITESYRGGIAVGFKAWKVLAVGEYAIVTTVTPSSQFKSVFVYGKLDGPLVELEFATISGVRLGFGYNSMVTLPSASQLYQFPFISDAATGDNPLAIINAMEGGTPPFVYKKFGGVWFAAGMTITCFDCITLTAVLMFEIETKSSQNGVIIALLADGVFQMEPLAPPDLSLFYVELLIKVELNFIEGYIAADAALAPASHVYVPSAHLTGSGSFYTWFPPSSHAGDWVVTIGGYHSAYNPPAHYPQNLQRLSLNFVVGDAVHVVGGAYVAVTPKCAMAGGSLHISVDVGPVSAYADIALDVFINFKPFYFIAEIRVSVGVDCEVDLLFVSFHVSISLGADLTLWGPDSFGGTAYVDFWFFGFSIDFGDGLRDPPGIPLTEFYQIVRTAGPDSTPPPGDTTSANNPYEAQHKYSIEAGIFPITPKKDSSGTFPNTGAATEWQVLAGPLQVRIDCDFSLSLAYLVDNTGNNQIQPDVTSTLNPIFAFPMHNTVPIISTLWISVYFISNGNKELTDGFQAQLVLKQAPNATWSMYIPDNDPLDRISGGKRNKPTALQDGSNPTVELCQGVRLFPPVAVLSQSPVVDFDATAAMKEPIPPDNWSLPITAPTQATLLSEIFEPTVTDGPTLWNDFAALWTGSTSPNSTFNAWDANGDFAPTTFTKAEMRGDDVLDSGMLGLLVQTLGWNQRNASETVKGDVQPFMVPDPKHPGQMVKQRSEWELVGAPPSVLGEELGYYYPSLPMVVTASA